ncbi:MAG: zinc ribbon domain-containing protein [Euryarchaeota archaeon]|nr:zinc ribbon domain-containing protein [Euryarchaeota archaeon]
MKCPKCGEEVILGAERCGACGAPLDLLEKEPGSRGPAADPAVFRQPVFGAPPARGPAREPEVLPWGVHEDEAPKTPVSFAGGLLILLGGILSMVTGFLVLNAPGRVPELYGLGAFSLTPLCGTLMLLFGLGAMLGGILGVFRKQRTIVMASAVLSIVSAGWSFLSMVLGFIGLILVAISKDDFD